MNEVVNSKKIVWGRVASFLQPLPDFKPKFAIFPISFCRPDSISVLRDYFRLKRLQNRMRIGTSHTYKTHIQEYSPINPPRNLWHVGCALQELVFLVRFSDIKNGVGIFAAVVSCFAVRNKTALKCYEQNCSLSYSSVCCKKTKVRLNLSSWILMKSKQFLNCSVLICARKPLPAFLSLKDKNYLYLKLFCDITRVLILFWFSNQHFSTLKRIH